MILISLTNVWKKSVQKSLLCHYKTYHNNINNCLINLFVNWLFNKLLKNWNTCMYVYIIHMAEKSTICLQFTSLFKVSTYLHFVNSYLYFKWNSVWNIYSQFVRSCTALEETVQPVFLHVRSDSGCLARSGCTFFYHKQNWCNYKLDH